GDARQIVMSADEVTTWEDGGQRVLLLKGQVLIEQSVLRARCQQAVARVDLDRFRKCRVYHVDVYAEGEVEVQNNDEVGRGRQAVLDLNTRGALRVRSARNKAALEARADDPLFQRGVAVLDGKPQPVAGQGGGEPKPKQPELDRVLTAGGKAPPSGPDN